MKAWKEDNMLRETISSPQKEIRDDVVKALRKAGYSQTGRDYDYRVYTDGCYNDEIILTFRNPATNGRISDEEVAKIQGILDSIGKYDVYGSWKDFSIRKR